MLYSGPHSGGYLWLSAVVLLVAVTGLLVWHFWNLLRLSPVAVGRQKYDTPPGSGSWEPLLYGLHQMQMRNKSAVVSWEA